MSDATADDFPLHFDFAALFGGIVRMPGPYIDVPDHGRFFLNATRHGTVYWFDERRRRASSYFFPEDPIGAEIAAKQLMGRMQRA